MTEYLLLAAVVILICVILNRLTSRIGIPMLLAFILLGMLFGSDGLVRISFDNYALAGKVCSAALIFIMFYGGFGTKWSAARPVALKALLLSSLGVVFTAGLTGLFCRFVLGFGWLESMLLGSVVGSTDAASVFSILRSRRLNLRDGTASLLELESGSNDPVSYMLTIIVLSAMRGDLSGGKLLYLIFAQLVYGAVCGVIIALAALWLLRKIHFMTAGFDTIFVLAIALLAYAVPMAFGGNGYLSAYLAGILMGNRPIQNKRAMVNFFDSLTGLMQMLIFFLLGLLATPSRLPGVLLPALLAALFLTLAARPLAVTALLSIFHCSRGQQLLVSWAGLRGAASIVFAILAVLNPAGTEHDLFHMVFCIVLFSILLQGSLLPRVAQHLGMIDARADVLRTFTDYTDEVPVQSIRLDITEGHPWAGKAVRDLLLPPDTLLVLLQRGDQRTAPRGDTVVEEGDCLVLIAKAAGKTEGIRLTETVLDAGHEWVGRTVAEVELEPEQLIAMVLRSGELILPSGFTDLQENDVLVISRPK